MCGWLISGSRSRRTWGRCTRPGHPQAPPSWGPCLGQPQAASGSSLSDPGTETRVHSPLRCDLPVCASWGAKEPQEGPAWLVTGCRITHSPLCWGPPPAHALSASLVGCQVLDGPWCESPRYLAACPQSPLPVDLGSPDTPTPCCLLPPPLGAPPGGMCPAAPTTQMVCGWVELGGAGMSTWKDAVRVNRTTLELASLPNPPALLPTLNPAGPILQSSSQ